MAEPGIGQGLAVLIFAIDPPLPNGAGLSTCFAAAAQIFGPRRIEDIVMGPGSTTVVIVDGSESDETEVTLSDLHVALVAELDRRGFPGRTLEVATLGSPRATTAYMREAIEHWIGHLSHETTVTAQRRSYTAALSRILDSSAARTLFQPIVDVPSEVVVGYEALSRGPLGHHLESATALLEAAVIAGLEREVHVELARLARERARERLSGRDVLLFINAAPTSLWTPAGGAIERSALTGRGRTWPLRKTVVELTERSPIHNPRDFLIARGRARRQGVQFALDDAGAGYAGLAAVAIAAPEFIKIDMELVRRCDRDRMKRAVISGLVHLAHLAGAAVVAEGVETTAELDVVSSLGVRLVQGFLFAVPTEFPPLTQPVTSQTHIELVAHPSPPGALIIEG